MTYGYIRQFPVLPPSRYSPEAIRFITPRVLELVYTAYDLKPFAEDMGYHGEPYRWDEERRALLRAELDDYYARLYGLNRKQLRYILDPADLTPREFEDILDPWEEVTDLRDPEGYAARSAASDFPGETFRVLKEKEIKQYGEYRTRRLVLEAWDRLEGMEIGNPEGYRGKDAELERPVIHITEKKKDIKKGKSLDKTSQTVLTTNGEAVSQAEPIQPSFSDFGLYKCKFCGKMVMGFDRENHEREEHKGKSMEWRLLK